jgi:hypothetical protein
MVFCPPHPDTRTNTEEHVSPFLHVKPQQSVIVLDDLYGILILPAKHSGFAPPGRLVLPCFDRAKLHEVTVDKQGVKKRRKLLPSRQHHAPHFSAAARTIARALQISCSW